MDRYAIFAGTANPTLAGEIAREMDLDLGRCTIEHFPDGEVGVQLDQQVSGADVVFVQPTSPPVNDHLVELLAFADACRRAEAARITAVVPYFGYARADTRHGRRNAVTARLVADLMEEAGIARVFTVDAHTPQVEGFFRIPFRNLTAVDTLCDALEDRVPAGAVVVSPDLGGAKTAMEVGLRFGLPVAVLHKQRVSGVEVAAVQVIGEVEGRPCLIIDDMITTGHTIAEGIRALEQENAMPEFLVAATHGVLVGGARETLMEAGIREVWITDTIARPEEDWPELRVVPIAPLIARTLLQAWEEAPTAAGFAGPARLRHHTASPRDET